MTRFTQSYLNDVKKLVSNGNDNATVCRIAGISKGTLQRMKRAKFDLADYKAHCHYDKKKHQEKPQSKPATPKQKVVEKQPINMKLEQNIYIPVEKLAKVMGREFGRAMLVFIFWWGLTYIVVNIGFYFAGIK